MILDNRIPAVVLAGALLACATDTTGPADGPALELAVSLAAGGVSDAYARTDQVSLRVTVAGETVAEETQPFSAAIQGAPVRVRLDRLEAGASIEVEVTMLVAGAPTFGGSGSGTVTEGGPTRVSVDLDPIIAGVALADPAATFTAVGERGQLMGEAVFATGDTIPGVEITWTTLDPEIVEVAADGSALAVAEGTARVEATAADITTRGTARVVPVAVRIELSPAVQTVAVGETAPLTARMEDRNGNVIMRQPAWTSSNPAVATVSAAGVVMGVSSGAATITARSDDVSATAQVRVIAAPPAPSGLTLTVIDPGRRLVLLTWQDNADNEDSFVVERQVEDGPWTEIATLPANTTSYEAIGLPGTNAFRVRACNVEGCSTPSNEAVVELLSGPPSVETLESPDIGIMAGSVVSGVPFQVRFQYGHVDGLFDPSCNFDGLPCYDETEPISATASGEFRVPAPSMLAEEPFFYRIVAVNEFGQAIGEQLSLAVPEVLFSGSYDGFNVVTELSVATPAGTAESPVQMTTFFSFWLGSATVDATPRIQDLPGVRRFIYDGNYPIFGENFEFVTAEVLYRTGAALITEICVGGGCSGSSERPRGRVPGTNDRLFKRGGGGR